MTDGLNDYNVVERFFMRPLVKRVVGWGIAAIVAATTPIIARWEGKRNETYRDVVGVWTVCYGETRKKYAFPGAKYTDRQCLDMLTESITLHYEEMKLYVKAPQTLWATAATLSMFYNFGATKLKDSTFVRKINAGLPPEEYCPEILRWNKARVNGQLVVLRGLTFRRTDEYNLCLGRGPWKTSPTILLDFKVE